MSLENEYRRWEHIHNTAMANAVAGLGDDATPEQLAAVVREADAALREIPPRVRAMETCMDTATRVVELLTGQGVRFANPANAPTQIAASMYGAWLWHDHHGAEDNTDWLAVVHACYAAVVWAVGNGDTAHPLAMDLVHDVTGPAEWNAAADRWVEELDAPATDWRALSLELAEAVELAAGNVLAVVGREAPKTRPRSRAMLAVDVARGAMLEAVAVAGRVREAAE